MSSQVLQTVPSSSRDAHKTTLCGLGIAECVLGGIAFLLGIATVSYFPQIYATEQYILAIVFTFTSQGIWAGGLIVISGILGVIAKSNPSVSIYNANMVLSIISAVGCAPGMVLSAFASTCTLNLYILFAMHLITTLCLLAGFVICIVHSAYCCCGVCSKQNTQGGVVLYVQP